MKYTKLFVLIAVMFLILYPGRITTKASDAPPVSQVLATREMSLDTRIYNAQLNDVYRDNILLTLSYMDGSTKPGQTVNWDAIRQPKTVKYTLPVGKTFAFHDAVLGEYKSNVVGTTNAHFGGNEGFKSDGALMGMGVCHLASLMSWSARDAQLEVSAPTNHNFAAIPQVPAEYGVSIYTTPDSFDASARQNLYITNTFAQPVEFIFQYDGRNLSITTVTTS